MRRSLPGGATCDGLASVPVPSEAEIAELRRRLSQAEASRQQKLDHLALRSGEAERLKAEAAVAARTSDLVSDDVALELRSARESAWSAHRGALSAATAAAFETALRRDDAAGAARLANARELAAARERAMKVAGLEAECARARADFAAADQMVQALDCEIAALLPAPVPEGRDALSFLNAWRARRDDALKIVEALRDMKEAARRADQEDSKARRSLGEALGAAGVAPQADAPLSALIETAELAVEDDARLEALRKRVKELRAAAALAEARHKKAIEDDTRWRAAWREACAGSWLGEDTALGSAREAVKALDELRALLNDCADLADRIDKMERDKRLFAAEVDDVARALGLAGDEDALRRSDAVERRVALARENERRRAARKDELEAARKELAGIARAETEAAKLASAMTTFFGVGSLAEVGERLRGLRSARSSPATGARSAGRDRPGRCGGRVRGRAREPGRRGSHRARRGAQRAQDPRGRRRSGARGGLCRLCRGAGGGSRRSAATTRSRASRKSGARSWKRSRTGRGAISRCAPGSRRRTRRCVSTASATAER